MGSAVVDKNHGRWRAMMRRTSVEALLMGRRSDVDATSAYHSLGSLRCGDSICQPIRARRGSFEQGGVTFYHRIVPVGCVVATVHCLCFCARFLNASLCMCRR